MGKTIRPLLNVIGLEIGVITAGVLLVMLASGMLDVLHVEEVFRDKGIEGKDEGWCMSKGVFYKKTRREANAMPMRIEVGSRLPSRVL